MCCASSARRPASWSLCSGSCCRMQRVSARPSLARFTNATRICEAKLGNLFLREANGYRNVALHGPPSRYAEWYQQEPVIDPRQHRTAPRAYLDRTREVLHITDLATDPAYDRHA